MLEAIFKPISYTPLYNALVFLTEKIPGHHLALAIIILTLLIKFILYPISKKAVVTQMKMKLLEPELKSINEKHKGERNILAQKTLEVYKKNDLNPFSTLFLALIQIPIFISLAFIFAKNTLNPIDTSLLYSFITVPEYINQFLLGINLTGRNIALGAIAGIMQYFQIRLSIPALPPRVHSADKKPNFKDDLARSMNVQMRYVMPVIVFLTSLGFTAAMSVYWIASTGFTIGQELYFRKTIKKVIK